MPVSSTVQPASLSFFKKEGENEVHDQESLIYGKNQYNNVAISHNSVAIVAVLFLSR
jgi:hypothetical protein